MPDSDKESDGAGARRVLIVTDAARAAFQIQLASAGYETLATTTRMTLPAVTEFAPDVLLMEVRKDEDAEQSEQIRLARQLRAKAATYALPLVFVFDEDGPALRQVSSSIGVDDYFALSTPFPEVVARLEALFWRVEAGRRAASTMGGQRLEIDNFLLLLDSVREAIRDGGEGALATIYAKDRTPQPSSKRPGGYSLISEVLGFFKLNLRRLDAVAFYGPQALIAYLPGRNLRVARITLSNLRDEFLQEHVGAEIMISLASFPEDAKDVEKLLEKCEAGATSAPPDSIALEHLELLVSESEAAKASSGQAVGPMATTVESEQLTMSPALTQPIAIDFGRAQSEATVMPRVLLAVSDAPRMARLNSLFRSAGYEVRAAFDGEQALNLLRIERPHLLVLDSELGKVDGLEMMRSLRKQGGGKFVWPVLFLNSSANENKRQEALALGARAVLASPYDPAELLDAMRKILKEVKANALY